MQVGRMEEDAAQEYVISKLEEVKQILDNIAYETGLVYVCFSQDVAEMFGHVGMAMISSLNGIMKVVPDRLEKANEAKMAAYRANEKELEEKKKQEERKA
jgi:hypothetical protein